MPFDHVERSQIYREILTDWAAEKRDLIAQVTLDGPSGASDRAQDNWTPLVRIAAAIGGDWPERTRNAFEKLEIGDKDDTASSIGLDLLKDIHAIMTQNSLLEMGAAQITKALIVLPDSE